MDEGALAASIRAAELAPHEARILGDVHGLDAAEPERDVEALTVIAIAAQVQARAHCPSSDATMRASSIRSPPMSVNGRSLPSACP